MNEPTSTAAATAAQPDVVAPETGVVAPERGAGSRLAYVDRLRVAAAITVVMVHVAAMGWYDVPPASADWQAMNVYASLSRWCVPIFFMVSGSLFLAPGRQDSPRRVWQRYVLRLLVMYVFWSAAYTLMSAVFQRIYTPQFLLQHLWDGYYHLWYLPAMAGVYALIPLLQRIVAVPSLARYFVILTGTVSVLLPTTAIVPVVGGLSSDLVERMAPFLVAGYPFYFVLGHLLHEYGSSVPRWCLRLLYVAAGLALAMIIGGTAWLSVSKGQADGALYGYLTLGVVVLSTAIFLRFRAAGGTAQTGPRLATMARWTLPIYLIHPAFVRVIQELDISPGLLPAAIGIPVIWLCVLALSVAASALLVKIPWVKNWLV